jgi:hypothetical protein
MNEITRRTKNVILVWAGLPEDTPILLDDRLSYFRPLGLEYLRIELNVGYKKENGFPIDSNLWSSQEFIKVRDVRDFVLDRIEGRI